MNTFLNQKEVAELLRISERTLERLRFEGTGPRFCKFGKRVVYDRADVEAWARARNVASTGEARQVG